MKIGIEVEGWAHDRLGGLIDVRNRILELDDRAGHHGHIMVEPGFGSIELASRPGDTVHEAVHHIHEINKTLLSANIHVKFEPRRPKFDLTNHTGPDAPATTGRYAAIWEATRAEAERLGLGTSWPKLGQMNEWAATHMHVSHTGVEISGREIDQRVINVINVLNALGPRIAKILCKQYRVDSRGHMSIWHGWASPARLPDYDRWMPNFQVFLNHIQGTPRLIRPLDEKGKMNGRWAVDLEQPSVWGEEDEGIFWWFARPRARYGTIEVRILPSWPLDSLERVVKNLLALVTHIMQCGDKKYHSLEEFLNSREWRLERRYLSFELPSQYSREEWERDFFN